jgi:hypothetical protein
MNNSIYRPPSVWITQALLVPFLISTAIALPIALFQCFSAEQTQSCSSPIIVTSFATGLFSFVLVLLTFWGLQKRKQYGRWLAVILLVGGMVVAIADSHTLQLIYRSITQWQPLPAPPYECWEKEHAFSPISYSCGYKTYQELALRISLDVIPALLLGFLAARLLYSRPAKLFFNND